MFFLFFQQAFADFDKDIVKMLSNITTYKNIHLPVQCFGICHIGIFKLEDLPKTMLIPGKFI